MSDREPTDAHLVLSAGGVRCLSYIGALAELERHGYRFKSVSTCSAGTLVGALYCSGIRPDEMAEEVEAMDLRRLAGDTGFKALRHVTQRLRWPYALYDEPGIRTEFARIVADRRPGLGVPRLGDLKPPLSAAAMDVRAERMLAYSSEGHPDMTVEELLSIATAVPLMYPPYTGRGREVVDAALTSYTPVWLATGLPGQLPVIVLRAPAPARSPSRRNVGRWLNDLMYSSAAGHDALVMGRTPQVRVHDIETGVGAFDFGLSSEEVRGLIRRGAETVSANEERWAEARWSADGAARPEQPHGGDRDARAEREAARRQRVHLENRAGTTPTVFISYAREDQRWVSRMRRHLQALVDDPHVTVWDDSYVGWGTSWDDGIRSALARARVIVLLVSQDFAASDYIQKRELPAIREQVRASGATVLWVSLDGTLPRGEEAAIQGWHGDERRLDRLPDAEAEEVLERVGRAAEAAFG